MFLEMYIMSDMVGLKPPLARSGVATKLLISLPQFAQGHKHSEHTRLHLYGYIEATFFHTRTEIKQQALLRESTTCLFYGYVVLIFYMETIAACLFSLCAYDRKFINIAIQLLPSTSIKASGAE